MIYEHAHLLGGDEVELLPSVMIGGTTLAIYCAEQWLRSGHVISAVVSVDEVFREWAGNQGIPCLDNLDTLAHHCRTHEVVHLFSIVNPYVLSSELINSVQGYCFNYHDSPLPRYAGQNATGWALLNQEHDYAISWHLLEEAVDQGDIVARVPVAITANETAFSLNLKCYQAARLGFDQLLTALEQKTLSRTAQNLAERSFYTGYRRPLAGGVLRWDRPAAELSALVRALNYGEYYVAPLDLPKILLEDFDVVRLSELEVLSTQSTQPGGTLLSATDDALVIATADFDVRVSGLSALGGKQTRTAASRHDFSGLQPGQALPLLTNSQQQALTRLHEDAARYERFWCERLSRFSPLSLSGQAETPDIAPEYNSWAHTPWQTWYAAAPHATGSHDSLLLAFILTLSRFTNCSDLQLGWSRPPQEPLFEGLISDSVPFHLMLDEQRTLAENLDLLAEEERRVSGLPSYVRTVYQRYPALRSLGGLSAELAWPILIADGARCPVAQQLTLHKEPGHNAFRLGYNPQVLDEAEVERFLGYLHTLGSQLSRCSARQRCVDLILLPPHEQEYLIHGLNPGRQRPQPQRSLAAQISHFAQITPEATALVFAAERFSYRQYDERAEQWACHLAARGVKPGDVIAFCARKSPATLIGFLATLKLGAIYLPLDPGYPAERLTYILQDSSPGLLLVDEDGQNVLSAALPPGLPMLRLDTQLSGRTVVARPLLTDLDLRQTAYIIYTSGSTGAPKGVQVSHANLCSLYREQGALLGVSRNSRILQFSSLSFDASIWEMAMALGYGGALYFPTERQRLDEQALLDFFRHHQITHATLPPALLSRSTILSQGLSAVVLTLAGEASGIEVFRQLSQRNTVINGYGPTEGTVCNAAWRCPESYDGDVVPIGRALGNSQLYLLDSRQRLVPFGAIGELCIGGEGVAQGYLNRPELNAQRFIPDLFHPGSAQRIYRTGDLARYLPDGNLLFIGREDHQVKIHGFRIELGDIEATLKQQDGIAQCTVIVRNDGSGGPRLVAYLVPEAGRHCEINELRSALENKLPAFMVPAAFVTLADMPLTPNGKIDRQALPAPDGLAFARETYEPVESEREQLLATLWGEYFQVGRLGRRDNFFALGGDSLLAIKLIGRLGELGWQANVEQLFKTPQLQAFAAHLALVRQSGASASGIPKRAMQITPEMLPLLSLSQGSIDSICRQIGGDVGNIQDIYPLSPLQQGLYFHHAMAERGDPYLLVTVLAFPDRTVLERYLAALQQVVERHDILRTAFVGQGLEQPVQVLMRHVTLPVTWLDLDARDGEIYHQLYERYDPRQFSIALDRAPLLQVAAVEDRPNRRWLLLHRFHHLVGDHTTLEVIYREVNALMKGEGDILPPASAFRTLIERTLQTDNQQRQRAFFSALLGDITEPCLPYGRNPLQIAGERIEESRQILSRSLNERLRLQARQREVSLASIFHVAWAKVLATISGQSQVVFGSVFFGRAYGDGSAQALGMFINTLPARVDIDTRPVDAAVQQMHQQLTSLLGYEQASLVIAQQSSGIAPPAPLFGALLNYRHNTSATLYTQPLPDFPEIVLIDFNETTSYPLVLSVEDYGHQTGLTLQAVASLCGERILAYTRQALESLVEALEQNPQTALQQLAVLPEAEVQSLIHQRNQPLREQPVALCVHQQFERQAALRPDAVAVVFAERSLTYAQLNRRANQLAHDLIRRGVQADAPVALCAVPGLEMMVGLLAILKAGAAYLPIDPAYAVERIRLILEDARPSLALCDAQGQATLRRQGYEAVLLLGDMPEDGDLAQPNPQGRAAPEQLAYIIYTSGSTGVPKGVMVEHRQVSRLFSAVQPWFGFNAEDVWCLFHSFAFDFSVWEIWGALLHGGRLVLTPAERTRDAAAFYRQVSEQGVTVLNQTPSAFRSFINEQRQRPLALALRYVIFGGEALDTSILAPWYESVGERQPQLVNMYGITETTVHVTYRPLSAEDGTVSQSPVGQRIPDLKLYLLDARRQPVPDGVVGELYVAGAGLARGYLNRPALTAERFVPDPFSGVPGERMYRTGDLARYRADGELEFIGRNDQQVKLRGYRIELGEIEAALNLNPAVVQAALLLREDKPGEARLVAYVVAREREEGNGLVGRLRKDLLRQLPDYMVPAEFVLLAELPLTLHGKLDRRALPEPEGDIFARESYEAPQGEVEEQLARIWSQLLGVDPIGRDDDFFALGGHSLLAVRLINLVQRDFDVHVELSRLFKYSTLTDFSRQILLTLLKQEFDQDELNTFISSEDYRHE
ncbi:non-ribosomal peptide synthetase [Brenneria corticis]|uniref:Non-ribosomal peptide synthetase module n=1 Tax=Brenneria corticis TaxID=2173106 RepID=A0A2U1TXA1_9GAMM|nr:non-ribosomal peptide synthetase [Brenneria sp. CFCC 11842]PWC14048.1 non-ribosomal peptide synthetase module [Brenneria sp. CFCC 11842]